MYICLCVKIIKKKSPSIWEGVSTGGMGYIGGSDVGGLDGGKGSR